MRERESLDQLIFNLTENGELTTYEPHKYETYIWGKRYRVTITLEEV